MYKILSFCAVLVILAACGDNSDTQQSNGISLSEGYSFEIPEGFPAAAAFISIQNNTDANDILVGVDMVDYGTRAELHTMNMENGVMRMRGVSEFVIPAGEVYTMQPGGDHIMIYGIDRNLQAGDSYNAVARFEMAGNVPFTVTVRSKSDNASQGE